MSKEILVFIFLLLSTSFVFAAADKDKSQVCSAQMASGLGYMDAGEGKLDKPGRVSAKDCKGHAGFDSKKFEQEYEKGFAQKQSEVCTEEYAKGIGYSLANKGSFDYYSIPEFRLCEGDHKLKFLTAQASRRAFVDLYCLEKTLLKVGENHASAGLPPEMHWIEKVCLLKFQKKFEAAYKKGYANGKKKKMVKPSSSSDKKK